ncbi:hypothetical protein [Cellvibrio japonicus]|nr:hypothetical protein [Cellvibrio japonicus]QEI13783.1 hypothetical protein FY117_17245 [Cellvibrio japonicus]QEI17357.1 hypothetical protein FY116_17250 [Cellvibrio japonicus]QEI20933.1 hypothetical protein FY115_17245 [Cellvibrio japonicus]
MKKYMPGLLAVCGMVLISSAASAIEEVIVTGTPMPTPTYDIPGFSSSTSGSYGSSFGFSGGYKDAAIAAAKKQCETVFATAQKKACDDKKEMIYRAQTETCNSLGTNGTVGMVVGSTSVVVGGAVAFAGGPIGWAVALSLGGTAIAGGGAVVQQQGNYSCRDQANFDYQYNTQACINYANKLKSEFCSKIY